MSDIEQLYEVTALNDDLMGLATKNNKPLIIRGALPGEKTTLTNVGKRKRTLRAQALDVKNPSKLRIIAKCQHATLCGGCGLQHIDSENQIELKQDIIKQQFSDYSKFKNISFSGPILSEPWGYRRKARLGIKYVNKKNKFLVGFREFNSKFMADISSCEILTPDVGKNLDKLSCLVSQLSIGDKVPQIEVTSADNATALLVRHLADFNSNDIKLWQQFGSEHNFHIYFQPDSYENSKQIFPLEPTKLYYDIPKHNLRLFFKIYDFIQVNRAVNLALIDRAIAWLELKPHDHVLEGFCGLGNFSLPFAKHVSSVTAIEYSASLLEDAAKNASYNKLTNIKFIADDLYNCKDYESYSGDTKFNKLFLDPPRTGAAPWLPRALSSQPQIVVYVSCNSKTLAQDAKILGDFGYEITDIALADMFPHTSHVETIAKFKFKG